MTELELIWDEYNYALQACHKYAELANINCELCHEACLDTIYYLGQVLENMKEIKDGFESFL